MATLALATSCTIMVNGKPVTIGKGAASGDGSGDTASGSESAGRAEAAPGAPDSNAHPDVVAYYQEMNFENTANRTDGGIPSMSGLLEKMRQGNPDPTWIPGWRNDANGMDLMSAMMQAAINRTWLPACHEDYAAYRAGWKPLEDEIRPKLAQLRQSTDYYQSVDELRELWAQAEAFARENKLNLPKRHAGRWSDLRMEILQTFVDLHVRLEDPFAPSLGDVDWKAYRKHAQVWTDPDDARDAYCMHADRDGTATLRIRPKLERWKRYDPNMVLAPLSSERKDALTAVQDALREDTLASLTLPEEPSFESLEVVAARDPGTWAETRVPGQHTPLFEVKKINRKGDSTELKVEYQKSMRFTLSCRRTNRVVAVRPDGRVEYEEVCKYKDGTYTISVTAIFDDLPANMVEVGDRVHFAGVLIDGKPDTSDDYKLHFRLKLEGVHLWTVVRDGQRIHEY